MLSARLPGVTFETRLQPVSEALPRMDVAAFVGFAASGPLHVPVAIEDPGRFREIFGPDPALAWDAEAGVLSRGSLGRTVESFFANGGRRCWVVRVADLDTAVPHRFRVPGLQAADAPASDVAARARSAGSWCESLAVGTALLREVLPVRGAAGESSVRLTARGYRVDLEADPDRFERGELLEVVLGPELPRLWLFVDRIESREGFSRLWGHGDDSKGHTRGAYWLLPPSALSPPGVPEEPPLALGEGEALDWLAASGALEWPGSPPIGLPSVRRLRFELLVWRGSSLQSRLTDLGFARAHSRFWGQLPTDEALYGSPSGTRPRRRPRALDAEARSPRFPLAGPADEPDTLSEFFLPIGMADRRDPALAAELPEPAATSLERDGLARFTTGLFLDSRLARLHAGGLLAEAEHLYYVRGRNLLGVHSLLPVEEASLISIPDAHHRGWTRAAPDPPDLLRAPELAEIPELDDSGRHPLSWTVVPGATDYRLERDRDVGFGRPAVIYEGAEARARMLSPAGCPAGYHFRVRAFRDGEASPWSNTRSAILPDPGFRPCAGLPPGALRLELVRFGSPEVEALSWTPEDPEVPVPASFELEESTNSDFLGTARTATVAGIHELDAARGGLLYFRVRATGESGPGVWSNTVVAPPTERTSWTLLPAGEYDDGTLLGLQRALVRFAAARRDLLAMLSLPPHYRSREALVHVGRLAPGGGDDLPPLEGALPVPPLTDGESWVLSYAALYHPWLTVRMGDARTRPAAADVVGRVPPDGAVSGSIAGLAVERGAWLAPANRPLARVLALEPSFDLASWKRLVPLRVNLITRQPEGFLLLSADTLSRTASLVPIHVRRLLMLLARLARREGDRYVFRPHDADFRHLVRHRFESVLADLFRRGAFAGADPASAYRVVADEGVNPPQSVDRGRFIVELRVAPVRELAFITVRLVAEEKGRLTVEEV